MRMIRTALVLSAMLAPFLSGPAVAQTYPAKPIRMIIPFPPGGGTDLVARLLTDKVGQQMGATMVVENRPGAGGTIGTDAIAKAEPDGYTFGVVSASHAVNPSLYRNLPFDSLKDIAPVTMIATAPGVLVVSAGFPAKDVKELIALARAKPGTLDYASAGNGTPPHLAAELFNTMTDAKLRHVPYKGNSQAFSDLLSGRVPISFPTIPSALPHIRTGKLRALAVTSAQRASILPDVPTLAEAGVPGYDASSWYAMLAPAGTPPALLSRMQQEVAKAMQTPEIRRKFAAEGLETVANTPEAFGKQLVAEMAKWERVVRESGAKID